jgi:protocatechuate 3,4-dioxygenase beta subunit
MERKTFLKKSIGLAGFSAVIIDACTKGASSAGSDSTTGDCVVSPTETEGPYPYPKGEINNPLNRADITGGKTGVPLALTLTVVNANNSCAVVENARVDIWHCDKDGYYSGYASQNGYLGAKNYTGETFLRGYLLTDAKGEATFTTIYPGWYGGRATHIHVEVFVDNAMKKTTQLAFPENINNTVYASSLYAGHGDNPMSNSQDDILGNSATDLANETVTITGDVANGYTAAITIGIEL